MNIQFFANRTAARDAAKAAGVKPTDNGKESAPGKRWSITLPTVETAAPAVSVSVSVETVVNTMTAPTGQAHQVLTMRRTNTKRRFPGNSRATMVTGHNGNKIPVTWRKSRIMGAV